MTTTLAGYQITALIYDGSRTQVYRGVKTDDSKPAVLKKLRKKYPTFNELLQFRHQYVLSKNLDLPGIVKPIALEKDGNGYVLVMEDVGGVSLSECVGDRPLGMVEFFTVAIALTKILKDLYRNRVIHKDIKPANILINPETKEIFLIDFSISSLLPRETQVLQSTNQLEGTLAYISPEQTGRMNRGIDYRSDFYSLGVSFYQLLAGKLPFNSSDPMELVHSQIARKPTPLQAIAPEIPQMLSEIVMKLMAKNAEDRYQSAKGIEYDLEKCWQQWQNSGKITPFEIATRDISDRFCVPEKLYGREAEVQTLLDAFERVANPPQPPLGKGGQVEMMLVAGFSGIGKTAVVNEVHKPIVRQRGYFIKGKFDQFQRNIPFSAFVIAFRDLMGQLLGESGEGLESWKTKILQALGENAQIIIEVIPELERIIGKQPSAPELSGVAAQNRFNRLFQKFIQVFTTQDHPLVMFVDDLQWADSASLKLMQLLMSDSQSGYLLLLGAYRDNEVFPAHPLMLTLNQIDKSGATVNTITLAPLSKTDINRLVADTLNCDRQRALPLTELVYQKTKGNPFFATQFLKGLHEDGWIAFDLDLGHWQCDMTRVRELALTDDVVEFIATRLHKLPEDTQQMLKLAACIGNQFDLATLAMACDRSSVEVAAALWRGLQEGLVLPIDNTYKFFQETNHEEPEQSEVVSPGYKFLHDRVQQAAYSLIPEIEKQATHYRIGKRLLLHLSPAEREERIFDLVNQINVGRSAIEDEIEKKRLIELNLSAGEKAIASTACEAAKNYFQVGIELLAENAWMTAYNLAFQLHLALAEAELMSVDFDSLEKTIATLLEFAKSPVDRARIYVVKVNQYSLQGPYSEAIKAGLKGLQELGIAVNKENLKELVPEDSNFIEETLKNRSINSLLDLPTATNREAKVAIELLMNLLSAAYISADIDLYSFTTVRNLRLSLEYGNIPKSVTGYVNYGFFLGLTKNQYQRGVKFADLAIQLSYKLNSKSQQSSACFLLGGWIHVWAKPIPEAVKINYEGFLAGMDSGELQYAGYNLFANIYNRLFQGENLAAIFTDMEKYCSIAEKIQNDLALSVLAACRFFIDKLSGNLDGRDGSSVSPEEQAWIERHQASQSYLPLGIYYILQMHEACLSQSFERGDRYETEARKFLTACGGSTTSIGYYYYGSLNLLGQYLSLSEVERGDALEQIEANRAQLKIWSESCAENFEHKYLLVEAERSRVEEKRFEAMELYDRAIASAKENGFIQEEALANELAAKFYLELGKEKVARGYMEDAYYCYARWGAKAKVDDLESRYQSLLAPILSVEKTGFNSSTTIAKLTVGTVTSYNTSTSQLLDLSSAIKTSQALSGEIELEGLLSKLMQVVMENAGASYSALLLPKKDTLVIEAIASYCADAPRVEVTCLGRSLPFESGSKIPSSIVNTVWRTWEPVKIDDAIADTRFAADTYSIQHQPQSILCTPLLNQGKLIGILYLENQVATGAFTGDRLEFLNILTSQAAISLENARLYRESQNYSQELEQTQLQLLQSEKMASIGELAAGVAHEINNPVGFISGNLTYTSDYFQDMMKLLNLYRETFPQPGGKIEEEMEAMELDYLIEDLPQTIDSMKEGIERITEISKSMRTFSRGDTAAKIPFNLHDGIDSTSLILKHRLKANENRPEIEIVKNYGNLPEINCYPGQLNQVFMNLIANAIDAFDEGNVGRSFDEIKAAPNRITITTEIEDKKQVALVKIRDNGMGMSNEVKEKVFEHLFTTKGVGKGTGLGLSISRQIVEEKHGGKITLISAEGKGTEFAIALPLT